MTYIFQVFSFGLAVLINDVLLKESTTVSYSIEFLWKLEKMIKMEHQWTYHQALALEVMHPAVCIQDASHIFHEEVERCRRVIPRSGAFILC